MPEALAAGFDAASEPARRRVTLAGVKRLARRVTSVAVCCFVGAGLLSGCSSDSDETPDTVAASTVAPAVGTTESSAGPTAEPVSAEPADSGGTAEDAGTADGAGTDTADQAAASQPDDAGDDQARADGDESDVADQAEPAGSDAGETAEQPADDGAVAAGDEQATQDAADGTSDGQGDGGTTGGDDGAASGAESGAEKDLGGTDAAGADDAGSTESTGDPDGVERDPAGEGADEVVTDPEPTEDRPKVLALAVAQLDGTTLDIGAFAGRDVLVWFWAPW